MLAVQAVPELILRPRPDRRCSDRFVHTQLVRINGVQAMGRDISTKGLCLVTGLPVSVGEVVRVSVGAGLRADAALARVARVERRADRLVVGLEFL